MKGVGKSSHYNSALLASVSPFDSVLDRVLVLLRDPNSKALGPKRH